MTTVKIENIKYTSADLFSFLSRHEKDVLTGIVEKLIDKDKQTRLLCFHHIIDNTIEGINEEVEFYMNGLINSITKHRPGNREFLKSVLEGIMGSVQKIEEAKENVKS